MNDASPYREPAPRVHPAWDHKQVKIDSDDLDKILTEFGANGWELVTACRIPSERNPTYYRLFFKRAK